MVWVYLFTILLIICDWAITFPHSALSILAEMKRQLRLRVIQRTGKQAHQELAQSLRREAAREGIDPHLAEEIIQENQQAIIEKTGDKIANEILGEPSPLERYH